VLTFMVFVFVLMIGFYERLSFLQKKKKKKKKYVV